MIPPRGAAAGVLGLALALAACAPALLEPPSLEDLAGHPQPASPADVDRLLIAAGEAFAARTLEGAGAAAAFFLRAALADRSRPEGLAGAARVQVWLAEHAPEGRARQQAARQAIHAAQWCARTDPLLAACDYWLGAGLGLQARERASTGLSALPEIEAAFKRAAQRDPHLEEGGPDRALALFFLRAPSWPSGPGDPDLGLRHAERAIALAPLAPANLLALAEARRAVGDRAGAIEALGAARQRARERLEAGDPDAAGWLTEAEEKLEERR